MKKYVSGISLIETVIVIGVFAVLGIISTSAVLLSLQGSKKGDAQVKVRENLDYAMSVIERQLRNADSAPCSDETSLVISYSDYNNVSSTFSCENLGPDGYVASGAARLTNQEISVTDCSFSCSKESESPPKIGVNITAVDKANQGSKAGATVTISTEINLRTY
jgi:Tfp pilus assembly protein PilW